MVAKDVLGCGGRIEMKCKGGCLRIIKLLYSCERKDESLVEQLAKVQVRCEKKESCMVAASRRMFGNTECPGSPDAKMKMWITYRCDGGQGSSRLTGVRRCPRPAPSTASPTLAPLPGPTCPAPHGRMVSKDIPLNGGWIKILCRAGGGDRHRQRRKRQAGRQMGCIYIHKVRADCNGGDPIDAHMQLVSLNMNWGFTNDRTEILKSLKHI